MLTNNFFAYGLKIISEFFRDIFYFPFWWYSAGLWQLIKALLSFISNREKGLAFLVWVKNLFRPMYGQQDWQGVLISFFMRLIMIIFKGIAMLFWCLVALAVFLAWLALPLYAVYQIIYQLNA